MPTSVRSVLAALLLAVPVAAEAVHLLDDDPAWATVTFALTQVAGWLLVGTVVRDLAAAAGGAGRWGSRLVGAGVTFQLVFAVAYLVSWAVAGEPAGATFVAFSLGLLCLTVGGLLWAARLRRTAYAGAGLGLASVAVLGFVAIAVGDHVLHDVALLGSYLSWTVVGRGVAPARGREPVSAGSR